jgi:hypothetical protein
MLRVVAGHFDAAPRRRAGAAARSARARAMGCAGSKAPEAPQTPSAAAQAAAPPSNEQEGSRLYDAARRGDLAAAREALAKGAYKGYTRPVRHAACL